MTTNSKIAIALGVGFLFAGLLWYMNRAAPAPVAPSGSGLFGGGGGGTTGDTLRGVGGGLLDIAGSIADAAGGGTGGAGV